MVITQTAWNVFDMSQTNLHWERHLKDLSETSQKRHLFWDVFKTSQIHLKKDIFFVTSLRRLKTSLKKFLLCDFFKTSRAYLRKDVFSVTSPRRLKNISLKYFWFFKNTSQMISCDFRRVITISDKIDVRPSETLRKWNILWEQCVDINQVCPVRWHLHESFGKSRIVKTQ